MASQEVNAMTTQTYYQGSDPTPMVTSLLLWSIKLVLLEVDLVAFLSFVLLLLENLDCQTEQK